MLTVPSIVIAIFAPFAGYIVDRWGRLRPLYVGIFLFVLGGSSGFYLDDFYAILAGRAVLGFAVALITTSSTALIGDYFDEELRHKFMSRQGLTVGVGGILFITLGGLLAQVHWSYPFVIYFAPLLFLPLLIKSLYEPTRHAHGDGPELIPSLLPVYLTGYFVMVLFYMLPTQLPYLIVNTMGGEARQVGFIIASSMIFSALTSMQYARIKAHLSYTQIYMATFVFFGVGLFIISQADTVKQLFYATAFVGMGFGLLFVNTNAWFLSLVSPSKRGKASGLLTSSFFLGQFSSPLLFEPIVSAYGVQRLFLVVAVVALGVALVLLFKSKVKNLLNI